MSLCFCVMRHSELLITLFFVSDDTVLRLINSRNWSESVWSSRYIKWMAHLDLLTSWWSEELFKRIIWKMKDDWIISVINYVSSCLYRSVRPPKMYNFCAFWGFFRLVVFLVEMTCLQKCICLYTINILYFLYKKLAIFLFLFSFN